MIITVCGSMQFHQEMIATKLRLEKLGYSVHIPSGAYDLTKNESFMDTDEEKILLKVEYDLIREHFLLIREADCIFVLNKEKNGIAGYIGGNTFLEMGLAFYLQKPIYLLNPVPEMAYKTEMVALRPIITNGDYGVIGS